MSLGQMLIHLMKDIKVFLPIIIISIIALLLMFLISGIVGRAIHSLLEKIGLDHWLD
jgi:hypothetical protein